MNPPGPIWWDFFGRLLIESSVLMAVSAIVSWKMSPQQQRKVWQVALTLLILLPAIEATGVHQRIRLPLRPAAEAAPPSRHLRIEVQPTTSVAAPWRARDVALTASGTWVPGLVWLAVSVCLLARSAGSRLVFLAYKGKRGPLNDPDLEQKLKHLTAQMNLRVRIRLSKSRMLAGPVAFGVLRRGICVPEDFENASPKAQEVMIAHELAHLAAKDPFWYAVVDVAAALFWFNPFVWIGRRQFQVACERAADEASLLVHEGAPVLAQCLVELGKRLAGVNSPGWIGMGGNRFRSGLAGRVNRLLNLEAKQWQLISARRTVLTCGGGIAAVLALLVLSASFARAGSMSLVERLWHMSVRQVRQVGPALQPSGTRYTRFFRVDRFEESLREFMRKRGRTPADSVANLKFLLEAANIELSPGTQMFYNSRLGTVIVRAPLSELEAIETAIKAVAASAHQLSIEAKFIEFTDPLGIAKVRQLIIGASESRTNGFRGVLPPTRYRELLKQLESQPGVDILSAPRVTTLSGRQAQIKVVDVRHVVTNLDYSGGETNGPKPIAEQFEFGPVLDLVPVVREDGLSIELTVVSTIREFIGYDMPRERYFDSGPPRPLSPAPVREYLRETDSASNHAAPEGPLIPKPVFRLRQAQTKTPVWDGQTLALALELQTPTSKNPNLKYMTSGKTALLFVTPTLTDRLGNRANNESALPFVEHNVPR